MEIVIQVCQKKSEEREKLRMVSDLKRGLRQKMGKVVAAGTDPRNWMAMVRGVAPGIEHRQALEGLSPRTVIDVGANKGQFAYLAGSLWKNAALYCFEPLPGPRQRLTGLMGGRATVLGCALGNTEGTATMHVASSEDSSSLLPLGRQASIFHMQETAAIEVPVKRLDQVIPGEAQGPILLKIDVQGFEYEVLQGATGLFDRIEWIYVEASFVELYVGQKLAADVQRLLEHAGYVQHSKHNAAYAGDVLVQADLLFKKQSAAD